MSTPSRFFNDCIDLEGGDAFVSGCPDNGTTSAGQYPNSFANVDEFGGSTYFPGGDSEHLGREGFEENPYRGYNNPDLDPGYDSTTTGNNTSMTPNTQASTRTTSTSGSNVDSHSSKSQSHHRHPQSVAPTERPADAGSSKKRNVGRKSTKARSNEAEEEFKRNKFLERNRIAASKCRQKKKEWVSGLEDQKAGLESKNSHLQMEYSGLLGEVSGLKEELMTHANCNDPNINQWLENEARKFVQETSDKLTGGQSRKGSGSRRHSSMSSGYQGSSGYANIDPLLRNVGDSSEMAALNDDMSFSPTDERESGFEHASSMFGS